MNIAHNCQIVHEGVGFLVDMKKTTPFRHPKYKGGFQFLDMKNFAGKFDPPAKMSALDTMRLVRSFRGR